MNIDDELADVLVRELNDDSVEWKDATPRIHTYQPTPALKHPNGTCISYMYATEACRYKDDTDTSVLSKPYAGNVTIDNTGSLKGEALKRVLDAIKARHQRASDIRNAEHAEKCRLLKLGVLGRFQT